MLQQTQVSAAIPFYDRFIGRFPDVGALASADSDEVMRHWSGLGYYARARNLHRASRQICETYAGRFPGTSAELEALAGVGRSTAAAIAVFAFGERAAILDGNVKRVLARCFAVDGWPGERQVEKRLWSLAESLLPSDAGIVSYTQGLMDLGSMVCVRAAPRCAQCPVADGCLARATSQTTRYPAARPRVNRPRRRASLLVIRAADEVLLERRPPHGIWGGLWSLPQYDGDAAIEEICRERFGVRVKGIRQLSSFEHGFTHFTLEIVPWVVEVESAVALVLEGDLGWWKVADTGLAGVPAPVRKLLDGLLVAADDSLA